MATDIAVGQNRSGLQSIKDTVQAANPGTPTKDQPDGKVIAVTKTGDAAWTTIVQAHGLTAAPAHVIISPTSAAAAAAAWVSAKDATNFTITFAAAPANAAVASFSAFAII